MSAKFYMHQRVRTIKLFPDPHTDKPVVLGTIGFIKAMPRDRILELDLFGCGKTFVFDNEVEPFPYPQDENGKSTMPMWMRNRLPADRRQNIDPVVRDMYDTLKAVSEQPAHAVSSSVKTRVNAAISAAQKHFKALTAPGLEVKEQIVSETFPGIYRETMAARAIYSAEEWDSMINVLYVKALDVRRREEGVVGVVVTGRIAPIEASKLKL